MTFLHEASSYSVTNVYIRAASMYVLAAKLTAAGDLLCWMCRTNSADNSQLAKPQRSARVESPGQGLPPTPALNTSKVQSNEELINGRMAHMCAPNDENGNPQRLYAGCFEIKGIPTVQVWDEGYLGHHAVPGGVPASMSGRLWLYPPGGGLCCRTARDRRALISTISG